MNLSLDHDVFSWTAVRVGRWNAAVTLLVRRERDKSSTSSKGRRQCGLAIGSWCRGAKKASSGAKKESWVVDWGNGVDRDELAGEE